MRDLNKNAGPISRTGITPHRTPVGQVFQDLKTLFNDIVGFMTLDIGHKPDAAGILFILGVIEALLVRKSCAMRNHRKL
jgi:hypothetical protein